MKNLILIAIAALSISHSAVANVKLEKTTASSKGNIELNVQANEDVMGIQFDMRYNQSELQLNGVNAVPDGYIFEYAEKDNGMVRAIMFSMEGERLNRHDIESLIAFDFTPANNFRGTSSIEFFNVVVAGKDGYELEHNLASMEVSTSNLLPNQTTLHPTYPNPFNPSANISYSLAEDGDVSVVVFDALGRQVAELINGFQASGNYSISWDASSQASGNYIVRMTAGSNTMTDRVVLVK